MLQSCNMRGLSWSCSYGSCVMVMLMEISNGYSWSPVYAPTAHVFSITTFFRDWLRSSIFTA